MRAKPTANQTSGLPKSTVPKAPKERKPRKSAASSSSSVLARATDASGTDGPDAVDDMVSMSAEDINRALGLEPNPTAKEVTPNPNTNPTPTANLSVTSDPEAHNANLVRERLMYDIVQMYFDGRETERLVRHQVESMNHFTKHQMQATIGMFNPRCVTCDKDYNVDTGDHNLTITYSIDNLKFFPPQLFENNGATKPMFPHEARLRQFTYASSTTVDLHVKVSHRYDTDVACADINTTRESEFTIPGLKFIDMPVMVGSAHCLAAQYKSNFGASMNECPKDCGGYFIVKGSEKVMLAQEHAAENRPYIFASKKPKWDWIAEFRSVPDTKCISPKQMEMRVASKTNIYGRGIYVALPRMKVGASIELFVLFRALGITSDRHICNIILLSAENPNQAEMLAFLEASMYDAALLGTNGVSSSSPPSPQEVQQAAFQSFMSTVAYNTYTKPPHKQSAVELNATPFIPENVGDSGDLSEYESHFADEIEYNQRRDISLVPRAETESEPLTLDQLRTKTLHTLNARRLIHAEFNKYRSQYVHTKQPGSFSEFFLVVIRQRKVHAGKNKDKKQLYTQEILNNEFFPHCKSQIQKVYLLGLVANRLIQTALGWLQPADRDSYMNKRVELPGTLINNLFRNLYGRFVKEFDKHILREINSGSWSDPSNIMHSGNIHKMFIPKTIESGVIRALSTGDFSVKQSGGASKVGVAQVLNRLNYPASLSHLRRINTPLEKTGELIAPRKLHGTTVGFLCPVETPEGQAVGGVKQLAIMSHVTIPTNASLLYRIIEPYIEPLKTGAPAVDDPDGVFCEREFETSGLESEATESGVNAPAAYYGRVKVIVNGSWIGVAIDPLTCYRDLKKKKYSGVLSAYTSIVFDYVMLEIRVCSDGGRIVRPLLRFDNGVPMLTKDIEAKIRERKVNTNKDMKWVDLVIGEAACIEYVDEEEQENSIIALRTAFGERIHTQDSSHPQYRPIMFTHEEISASTWLGVLAGAIPFSNMNQSPRNAYQCAMGKQAMGVTATKNVRMDKTSYVLAYPSQPLVCTKQAEILKLNELPAGYQIHVAIASITGYNQEDSLLVSQGAVDRGLFVTTVYHTEKDEDKGITRDEVVRCVPEKHNTRGLKLANYSKLEPNGFNRRDAFIGNRDILMGKKVQIKENRNDPSKTEKYDDKSKVFRTSEDTYIDRNHLSRNGEGYTTAKTQTRTFRKVVIGDKLASVAAQKGTTGLLVPAKNMPFTKDGIPIDAILNPHAIPSRMTIPQLMASNLGKVMIELGMFGDGTCFGEITVEVIIAELRRCGFEGYGNEIMYDGHTGEQMNAAIFVGPVHYQRLKHMVNDKEHSRANGPMVNLTRQPKEGRARDGGHRIGEMERDVFLAHGINNFMRDRMFDVSDKYGVHVCGKCGMLATYNDGSKSKMYAMPNFCVTECRTCKNLTEFGYVDLPYSAKLLFQELQTINVVPRIMYK